MYWEKDQRWVVRLDSTGKEVDRSVLKDAKRVSDYDKDKLQEWMETVPEQPELEVGADKKKGK